MNILEIVILLALAVWLFFAVRHIIRRRGSCSGDCGSCPYKCKKK